MVKSATNPDGWLEHIKSVHDAERNLVTLKELGRMELIEKDNMITAWGTKDGVATVIGVDFGHKNDYAVKTVLKKHPNGRVEVVSSEPIGRTIDFNDPASRQKVIDEIRNFKL